MHRIIGYAGLSLINWLTSVTYLVEKNLTQESEVQQLHHYNEIIDEYDKHYGDFWSRLYRRFFIENALFQNLPPGDLRILDAMCGSGYLTESLIQRGRKNISGLDISNEACENYKRRFPGNKIYNCSILNTELPDGSFDVIAISGGLHHLHPHLEQALEELWRLIPAGGLLCVSEPHAGSLWDKLRKLWYAKDPLFESNEESVNFDQILQSKNCQLVSLKPKGFLAYFLIFNSMIFRIPGWLKNLIAPPCMVLEWIVTPFLTQKTSVFLVGTFKKLPS